MRKIKEGAAAAAAAAMSVPLVPWIAHRDAVAPVSQRGYPYLPPERLLQVHFISDAVPAAEASRVTPHTSRVTCHTMHTV